MATDSSMLAIPWPSSELANEKAGKEQRSIGTITARGKHWKTMREKIKKNKIQKRYFAGWPFPVGSCGKWKCHKSMLHYCGAFQTLFQTLRKCRVWPQNGLNVFLATMREANNNQMVCCLFFGLKGKVNWPGRLSCCRLTCVIIINRKLHFSSC